MKERYIYAVLSYFAYRDNKIKDQITSDLEYIEEDDLEALVALGHPKAMAYGYGYRNGLRDFLNHIKMRKLNDYFYIGVNLFYTLVSIFYLWYLNLLPFQPSIIVNDIKKSGFMFILTNVFYISVMILALYILLGIICIYKDHHEQVLEWDENKLARLPSLVRYRKLKSTKYLTILINVLFTLYFFFNMNTFYGANPVLHHFFQPLALMLVLDMIYTYKVTSVTSRYNYRRIVVNTFVFICSLLFLRNVHYLDLSNQNMADVTLVLLVMTFVVTTIGNIVLNINSLLGLKKTINS